MKRTPIRKVSTKRSKELREYSKLRKEYLALHCYCQATIKLEGFDEAEVIANGGRVLADTVIVVPRATEIHHVKKRYGSRLNDTSGWLAVSRELHEKIEREKSWARKNGLLDNY
jgi:hypothetical protein